MIDTRRKGMRCRAIRRIRIYAGMITPSSQGTIAYETENVGRQLIYVQWDTGNSAYVFPDEIEIMGSQWVHSKFVREEVIRNSYLD